MPRTKGHAFPVDRGWRQLYRRAPGALNENFPQQRVLLIGISLLSNVKKSQRILLNGAYLLGAASPVKRFIKTSYSSRSELVLIISLAMEVLPASGSHVRNAFKPLFNSVS